MEPNKIQEKSNGALIGLVIIVIILVIGGIYYWKTIVNKSAVPEVPNTSRNVSDTSGTSANSTANLDAAVNSIDLDSLDSGI